jgi:peptidyl-prolyl cis-trans isomerase A (cyclophilin A)
MRGFAMAMVVVALALAGPTMSCAQSADGPPRVGISTTLGDIVVEVYPDEAPISAGNFLRYVDEARLDSAVFYRVVTLENQSGSPVLIEVIQGGLYRDPNERRLDAIEHETTDETGILHLDGTLSMARGAPGTASSELFITIGDQPSLDYGGQRNPDGQGFAAFGRVVEGMDVVRAIQAQPEAGQMLTTPVLILEVRRLP